MLDQIAEMLFDSYCACFFSHLKKSSGFLMSSNVATIVEGGFISILEYLLNEVNGLLKVHAKVNECPLNALASVFFLLKDEHMMIEELLQLLVGEVDA